MTDSDRDHDHDHDSGVTTLAGDVEEPEELLVEEISIDGMCGVY